jgi:hypothetical protein
MNADVERRVFEKTISSVERRISRRSFVVRAAGLGSLIAVAPVRFLTRQPQAAGCVRHGDCRGNTCGPDGYTAFCCTTNGKNSCPSGTFIGGYWACTNFKGKGLCNKKPNKPDVRWYLDCHAKPGKKCAGCGCHCAKNKCGKRRTCCTKFRYGQCNRHIDPPGPGDPNHAYTSKRPIKCRIVRCSHPHKIWPSQCNEGPVMRDNNTCTHSPGCNNR